jgi:hypothetical protein
MARSTVDNGLDPLYIGLPGTVGTSVGVGNLNTKGNALTTIITLRHSLHLLSEMLHQNHALNRRLDMIAEFYQKRDRGKGYAEERRKLLIENSIFNNAELEKNKYALSEQIEGFIKEIYSEHGDPVSAVYAQRNGYDTAVVMMEDGFELQLRVITVRTGVFDFEEVY